MTTDRKLLELAAKAAGWAYYAHGQIDMTRPDLDGWIDPATGDVHWRDLWRPLTDDGDALRLAVKLELVLAAKQSRGYTMAARGDKGSHYDQDISDPAASMRRAIVYAAAEIGRSMT